MLDDTTSPETHNIIGALLEVHRHLGPGLLEAVYQWATELEFGFRGIPHVREPPIRVIYKGHEAPRNYRADFLCHGRIIVELKAVEHLAPAHEAQAIHYLQATECKVALLASFGGAKLQVRRFVRGFEGS